MLYVGIDVHQNRSNACILGDDGQKVKTLEVRGHVDKLIQALRDFARRHDQPMAAAFEASLGYGPIHERLSKFCHRVVVAHPGKLRLISQCKRKHDRIDAEKLAVLLRVDLLPQVHVPKVQVRHWRKMIEFRRRAVDARTRTKNSLRSLLRSELIVKPKGVGGLWTKKGLAWLAQVELDPALAMQRDMLLDDLTHQQQRITRLTAELDRMGQRHPAVALLKTIPGVGPRTAEAFVAYIDRPERFGRSRQAGTYVGLVPCEDSSGGKQRLGHITKEGPGTLRKLLVEASWRGVKTCPRLAATFDRLVAGDPGRRKIAIVAMARRLAELMCAMMRSGEVYRQAA